MKFRFVLLVIPISSTWGFSADKHTSRLSLPQIFSASNRRTFLVSGMSSMAVTLLMKTPPAYAIPMVSTEEFRVILRDSAQAIKLVEFSGPKSETVTVRLIDGTSFGINDVIESSTDPRSPLMISALCRENLVVTKFTSIEAALAGAPKKKKIYANERVQIAAEKEKARKARIEQDEVDRLATLYEMEQAEAAALAAKASR